PAAIDEPKPYAGSPFPFPRRDPPAAKALSGKIGGDRQPEAVAGLDDRAAIVRIDYFRCPRIDNRRGGNAFATLRVVSIADCPRQALPEAGAHDLPPPIRLQAAAGPADG